MTIRSRPADLGIMGVIEEQAGNIPDDFLIVRQKPGSLICFVIRAQQLIELSHESWRSNGQQVPNITIRLASGGYIGGGLYHSQNIEGFLTTIPGIRVVVPATNLLQGVTWHPSGKYALVTMLRTKNLVPMTRMMQGWTVTNGLGIIWADGRVDQVLLD